MTTFTQVLWIIVDIYFTMLVLKIRFYPKSSSSYWISNKMSV